MDFIRKYFKLLISAVFIFLAFFFWQYFMMIVISFIIFYLLDPVVHLFEKIRIPRTIAIIIVLVLLFVTLYFLMTNLIPVLISQIKKLNDALPSFIEKMKEVLEYIKTKTAYLNLGNSDIINTGISKIEYLITFITDTLISIFLFLLASIPYLVLIPIIVFYLLKDKDLFFSYFRRFFNMKEKSIKIMDRINSSVIGYIKGTLLDCLLIGAILTAVFYLFKLKYSLILGGIAGLFIIIPYIGPVIGTVPAFIIAIIQFKSWQQILLLLLIVGVIQLVNGYILQPKIIGKSINFHPLIVLFIVIIGTGLLGGIGLFISIPVAIILKESMKGLASQ